MIDNEDEKRIEKMIFKVMTDVLEQIVLPKFDQIDERFDKLEGNVLSLKEDVGGLKEDVGSLKQAVEILDSDMGGVKMRLKVVENKLDGILDTTLVVRDHEKRISKLEKSLA